MDFLLMVLWCLFPLAHREVLALNYPKTLGAATAAALQLLQAERPKILMIGLGPRQRLVEFGEGRGTPTGVLVCFRTLGFVKIWLHGGFINQCFELFFGVLLVLLGLPNAFWE